MLKNKILIALVCLVALSGCLPKDVSDRFQARYHDGLVKGFDKGYMKQCDKSCSQNLPQTMQTKAPSFCTDFCNCSRVKVESKMDFSGFGFNMMKQVNSPEFAPIARQAAHECLIQTQKQLHVTFPTTQSKPASAK